jgi:xanthine dehydrogenase YagR molybdenum-binding subunit
MIAGNRPGSIQKCKFSAAKDGTLLGAEVRSWGDTGVAGRHGGVANPAVYRFRAQYHEHVDVATNAGAPRAFRAPRHPQGFFALEGMIDELAEALDMDPLALRRKNDPDPVRAAQWEAGAKEIGWERRKKSGSEKGRLRRGLGCAAARWHHTGRPGSAVRCRIGKDGSVLVANGAQDIGTGTRTVLAILVAVELGLTPADVTVRLGDTNDPVGPPSGGSQTTPSIAPPARRAGWLAKRELLQGVAAALGGDAAKMELRGGKVVGAPRDLTFKQACALLQVDAIDVTGQGTREDFSVPIYNGAVAGCQFAEVEVDTDTGSVRSSSVSPGQGRYNGPKLPSSCSSMGGSPVASQCHTRPHCTR